MKAILVIDKPKDCFTCELGGSKVCIGGCPLEPIPKRIDWLENSECADWIMFATGWNACLDDITGGTE